MGGGSFILAEEMFIKDDELKSLLDLNNASIASKSQVALNYQPWVHSNNPTYANVLGVRTLLGGKYDNEDWFPEMELTTSGLKLPNFANANFA